MTDSDLILPITSSFLDEISSKAKDSPRLRMNYNFHEQLDAPSQRLLNALEPGTVMPIHRHQHTQETYLVLRGRLTVNEFDDEGTLLSEQELNPLMGNYGVNIPKGVWHSITILEENTVIFECKDGPYAPLGEEDIKVTSSC